MSTPKSPWCVTPGSSHSAPGIRGVLLAGPHVKGRKGKNKTHLSCGCNEPKMIEFQTNSFYFKFTKKIKR